MSANNPLSESVKDFYSDVATDLSLLCEINNHQLISKHNEIISQLHEETMKRYYGSGFLIPDKVEGCKIVDLGCGSGSLVFILSKLVGEHGHVVGFDLVPILISEAKKYVKYHSEKWGYSVPNTEFRVANIEKFDELGFKEKESDVVVSNGVLCVCPNQREVFINAYRLLKDGGEFCLSDVYADRDRPVESKSNSKLFCLGLSGSMKWEEIYELPVELGFTKPYLFGAAPVALDTEELRAQVDNAEGVCAQWRFFKLPAGARRSAAEVTYNGNISGCESSFRWDVKTTFKKGQPVTVDSDLASILAYSRYKDSFAFKDTTVQVKPTQKINPFTYLDECRAQGQKLTPVYKI